MKNFLLIFLVVWLKLPCFSQQDIYVGSSFIGGIPSNSYAHQKEGLYSRKVSNVIGATFFVQYRLAGRIGVEAGAMQQTDHLRLQEKRFAERNPGFQVRLNSNNSYWSYYGALSYCQPLSSRSDLVLTSGYMMHMIGATSRSTSKNFIVSGEDVSLSNAYQKSNTSVYLEAGWERKLSEKLTFFTGIRYNHGLSTLFHGQYSSSKDGNLLNEEEYHSKGSFLALNIGVKVNIVHQERKMKEHRPVTPPVQTNPVPQKVEGRMLKVTHQMIVKSNNVAISVWDDQKVDGDRVSLNLNGQWIITDYTLDKKKKSITVTLKPGENVFVLHALNLGKIKPNTAALMVDDGITQQTLLLESDMESSGTLIIEYKK